MDTSISWGRGAEGYWKYTFLVRSTALVRDFTPSRGPGSGKLKATRSEGQLVVRLCLGLLQDKVGEVAAVALELEVLVVDDVRAYVVEELRVVGNEQTSAGLEVYQVVSEPFNGELIQVVGRLIE